jgi:hypothetical protein
LSLEESLWTHSAEFSDIALKLSKELKANIKKVQKEIVQAELKERINKLRQQVAAPPIDTEATEPPIEDTSDTRETAVKLTSKRSKLQQLESDLKALEQNDNTALENPACQEIIKLKSETIVNKVKHNVETENREFIAQQHNQRDAQLKTSHAGGGADEGDGGGFGYEEVSSGPEDKGNRDGSGREHDCHERLNKETMETPQSVYKHPPNSPRATAMETPQSVYKHPPNSPRAAMGQFLIKLSLSLSLS